MIVVTTPTGNIGRQVLARLLDSPEPVRVIVRDPSKLATDVRERVEIVQGSHVDLPTVTKAFEGANSLFWLPPGNSTAETAHAAYVEFSRPAASVLKSCGVKRVVAVSALGRGWPRYAGQVTATLQTDDMFAETGVAYRALACGSLMENTLRQIESIKTLGMIYGPSNGDRKGTAVATGDVARCAVDLLLDNSWHGVEEVPLKGPEAVSSNDMAETMSDVLGKAVKFQEIAMSDFRAALIGQGTSTGMADATVALITAKGEGIDDMVAGPTPSLTPTTFAQWCRTILRPAIEG